MNTESNIKPVIKQTLYKIHLTIQIYIYDIFMSLFFYVYSFRFIICPTLKMLKKK